MAQCSWNLRMKSKTLIAALCNSNVCHKRGIWHLLTLHSPKPLAFVETCTAHRLQGHTDLAMWQVGKSVITGRTDCQAWTFSKMRIVYCNCNELPGSISAFSISSCSPIADLNVPASITIDIQLQNRDKKLNVNWTPTLKGAFSSGNKKCTGFYQN